MNPASCPKMGVFCRAQPAKADRMSEADTISASAAPGANAHAAGSLPNGGLEVISIAKSYDKRAVLSDISLHVAKGEVLGLRSEEHTSELQSLMRISYAVFCLKKKKAHTTDN